MPITEAQMWIWLSNNWPSVVLGLSAASIYVAAYLKLQTFLGRVKKLEDATVRHARELVRLRAGMRKVVLTHCQKYPLEMESLMQITEEAEPDGKSSD